MSSFNLRSLTEGIQSRNMSVVNTALTEKWNRTGLLKGLTGQYRENMARMLENQAGQVLKEASSISTGGGTLPHPAICVDSPTLHSRWFAVYSVD